MPSEFHAINKKRVDAARKRRNEFIAALDELKDIDAACEATGVPRTTYKDWRKRIPEFASRCDAARLGDASKWDKEWEKGFAAFRSQFLGMDSPWFHLEAIDAYENTPPGNITLILWPPEHGKTTLFEDYATYKLATDPTYRFCVASEKQGMSQKVLARVKARLDPMGAYPKLVTRFGPFVPQNGVDGPAQPWGANFFNVFKKGSHDERDYSMVALGITSAVAGTRTDHLHADDVQSLKSLNLTETLVNVFRQDWLSRPGEHGRTSINGTRVGEDDFYERIELEFPPEILRIIRFPAIIRDEITGEDKPLWPERYTMEMLERIKIKAGPDAWARNYMQNPLASGNRTFDDDALVAATNPLRRIGQTLDSTPGTGIITLDPALGGKNCVTGLEMTTTKLALFDTIEQSGLTATKQIWADVEAMLWRMKSAGLRVSDVVIETMAFQKGLATDDGLRELRSTWGFAVREHLTGVNKYDENIGIPTMVNDYRTGKLDLPGADDPNTRSIMDETLRQHKAWRPLARGNRLRQDRVMGIWFGWILWRERAQTLNTSSSQFNFKAMPFQPTSGGLFIPRRAS